MAERLKAMTALEFKSRIRIEEFIDMGVPPVRTMPLNDVEVEKLRVYMRGEKPLDAAAFVELDPILAKMPRTRERTVETVEVRRAD